MTASPKPTGSSPAIKLFQPNFDPDRPDGLSARMTLSEFFEAFIVATWSKARHMDAKTLKLYREAISYWVKFTGDPPLDEISDQHCADFLDGLYALPGRKTDVLSSYTVKKHRRHVQTCLNLTGPRSSRFKAAKRLLIEVPYLEDVPVDEDDVDDNFELEEITAILKGAIRMRSPKVKGVPAPVWWQSLVICTYNLGERRGAMLQVPFSELRHSDKKGWTLKFPPRIRKGKVKTNIAPVNEAALAAIERIRTERELIFEFPSGVGELRKYFPDNARHFSRLWQKLLEYAGIPDDRRFGLHGLRKATATEAAAFNPLAAQLIMGHGNQRTTTKHYINPSIKAKVMEQLPQPSLPLPDPQMQLPLKAARKPKPKPDATQLDFLPPVD